MASREKLAKIHFRPSAEKVRRRHFWPRWSLIHFNEGLKESAADDWCPLRCAQICNLDWSFRGFQLVISDCMKKTRAPCLSWPSLKLHIRPPRAAWNNKIGDRGTSGAASLLGSANEHWLIRRHLTFLDKTRSILPKAHYMRLPSVECVDLRNEWAACQQSYHLAPTR